MSTVYSPRFIYGSMSKGENTSIAIQEAVSIGFKALDTANCCGYFEQEVGIALEELYKQGYKRSDFWIQSKFTFMYSWYLEDIESALNQGKPRPPFIPDYDHKLELRDQIIQSLDNSLIHLRTEYLDSYILHGPFDFSSTNLDEKDLKAWEVLEELYDIGKVRAIGVSSYSFRKLVDLSDKAKIKPMILQSKFVVGAAKSYWPDQQWLANEEQYKILEFCKENNIEYQSFGHYIADSKNGSVASLADAHNVSHKQMAFRFAYQNGVVPVTGAQKTEHMQGAIDIFNFELSELEMGMLGEGPESNSHDEL